MNKRFIFLIAFVSIMIGFAFAPEQAIGAGRRLWIDSAKRRRIFEIDDF